MRIALNSRSFLNPHYTGIGRYAFNLVNSLLTIDQRNDYFLYVPKSLFDREKIIPSFKAKNLFLKRDYFKRGLDRVLPKVDIYHSPSPDMVPAIDAKIIVTLHDLVYKAYSVGHTEQTLQLTDQQIKSFLPRVSKIICCSKHTQDDLHRFFEVDRSKSCVIYHGVDKNVFYPMTSEQKQAAKIELKNIGIAEPFILFVGTIEPRKNLKGLLEAFAQLKNKKQFKGKLVVAGMKGWKSDDIAGLLKSLNVEDDVIFLGFIGNDQLRYLYNGCEVFVFPSFYEGFGYPILEAFSCGAPVVSSTAASCAEVAGDAALSIDPAQSAELSEAISNVLQSPALRASLVDRGIKRAAHFTFEKNAAATLKVYEEVYSSSF